MTGQRPTDILREEHKVVLEKLSVLERALRGRGPLAAQAAGLHDVVAFFEADVELHLRKEEEALFPEMEITMPREGGPIGVMFLEHQEIRRLMAEFQTGVRGLGGREGSRAEEQVRDGGLEILRILRPHIHKENYILFPMADSILDAARDARVLEGFAAIEAGRMPAP